MIDFVRGQVAHLETEYIVVDVQGIGYRVFCPNPYAFAAKGQEPVTVYTHHSVREDAILLYGFSTREEQKLFRRLIDVSGIGPRVALGILAGGTPEKVVSAIQQENVTFLTKLPGIGKKTAQRMILDLKDRLDGFAVPSLGGLFDNTVAAEAELDGGGWKEAREGLEALGYTEAELDKAWMRLKEDIQPGEPVDVLMKRALKLLYQG
ncbi:Holliday junction branch migration protein RuvA [Saccharibacillus sp. CPCC 101409]|uniref:Holliday junction branch migration protein RuvA n=1 Tax=Saccharibacillus sp. CPCC 101409 TaxID=3058041 RepID=UPI002672DD9A|nr:Holliday junction branch migration protein RuvA [Saccharibacillus sp. CPCC 101409]MDO3408996.1 Holliday junction branch migration protein RuvA [Saccharibacillus sp. CPCC 101409]